MGTHARTLLAGAALALAAASASAQPGQVLWSVDLAPSAVMSEPTVGPDGTIYVHAGRFYAVAPDGQIRWDAPLGDPNASDVGLDGTVYAASNNTIHAFDGADGTPSWSFTESPMGQGVMAGPTVGPDGNVYAVFDAPGMGAVSLTPGGDLRWSVAGFLNNGGTGLSRLPFAADRFYFAEDIVPGCDPSGLQQGLVAVTLASDVDWCLPLSGVARPVAPPSGRAYVKTLGGVLRAVEPDGDIAWTFALPVPANSAVGPGVGPDGAAYLFRNNLELWAIEPEGDLRWTVSGVTGGNFPRTAAVSPDNLTIVYGTGYSPGGTGSIFGLDVADGSVAWTTAIPGAPAGAAAAAAISHDGRVAYIPVSGSGTSRLLAIALGWTTLPAPPVAVIVPSVLAGPAPLTVQFDGSGSYDPDGSIVSWTWAFGDGVGSPNPVVDHTYLAPGFYYATLYVTSNDGAQANDSVWIEVKSGSATSYSGEAAANGVMLFLSKVAGDSVKLDWGASCVGTDTDYGVYAGPLGSFPAHLPMLCSTGGATSATITPSAASTYYLVVPNNQYYEGSYGQASSGAQTPAGPTRCYPAAAATGCR